MPEKLLTRRTTMARDKVVNLVESWVSSGKLRAGDSLPAEQKISDDLGIARGTVRSGLQLLEDRKVICKRNQRRIIADKKAQPHITKLLDNAIVLAGLSNCDIKKFHHSTLMAGIEAAVTLQLETMPYNIFTIRMKRENRSGYFRELIEAGVKGVIFFQDITLEDDFPELFKLCIDKQACCVINSGNHDFSQMSQVSFNHVAANYQLTRKLIDRGCRNIANISRHFNPTRYWVEEKYIGYKMALQEAGLTIPPLQFRAQHDIDYDIRDAAAFERYSRLFAGYLVDIFNLPPEKQADAILVNGDWDIPLVNAACEIHGKTPGKDVLIAGYDNKFDSGPFLNFNSFPPAFTVDKQHDLTGEKMVDLLVDQINSASGAESPKHIKIEAKIIEEI